MKKRLEAVRANRLRMLIMNSPLDRNRPSCGGLAARLGENCYTLANERLPFSDFKIAGM
jgi:hypothetical protein